MNPEMKFFETLRDTFELEQIYDWILLECVERSMEKPKLLVEFFKSLSQSRKGKIFFSR
jgi:hypothetical protein